MIDGIKSQQLTRNSCHEDQGCPTHKVSASVTVDDVLFSISDSQNDTGVVFGVGGTWSFNPALALRFGYAIYKDAIAGEDDVNQFFAGLQYSFIK